MQDLNPEKTQDKPKFRDALQYKPLKLLKNFQVVKNKLIKGVMSTK